MKRWKTWLLVLLVLVLLVPATLLVWVVTTERGLQTATRTVDRIGKLGPVTLQIRDVSGSLSGGAHFGHVEVHHRNADIVARDISGRLELLPLLGRRIDIQDARIAEVTVQQHPVKRAGPPVTPRFLAPMMRLHVEDARIDRLLLSMANGVTHEATNIAATATILPKEIRVRQASAELPAFSTRLTAQGRMNAKAPLDFDGHVDLEYSPENLAPWRIAADFDGDLNRMPLRVAVSAPFRAQAEGIAHTLSSGWRFEGQVQVEDFDLADLGGGDALGLISGTLDVSVGIGGIKASGSLEPAGLQAGAFDVSFDGQYRARQLQISDASVHHPPSGTRFTTSGEVLLREGGGQHLDLQGEWTNFRWPLLGAPAAFHSAQGRYSINGDKPWQVQAAGVMQAAELPSMPFDVAGTLETQRFVISRGQLDALGGQVLLTGEARWAPNQSWRVDGQARGINPAALRPDLPGRINFSFAANGSPFGERRRALGGDQRAERPAPQPEPARRRDASRAAPATPTCASTAWMCDLAARSCNSKACSARARATCASSSMPKTSALPTPRPAASSTRADALPERRRRRCCNSTPPAAVSNGATTGSTRSAPTSTSTSARASARRATSSCRACRPPDGISRSSN